MSFDKELSPSLIYKLYRDVLYDIDENNKAVPQPKSSITFLGGNRKQITIIVYYDDVEFIPPKQQKFLIDIIGACKLNLEDVVIINQIKAVNSIEQIYTELSPKIILAFNINSRELLLQPDLKTLIIHQINDLKILFAPALNNIEVDVAIKKQFWLALRNLFDV